jgi:hypothetical protein
MQHNPNGTKFLVPCFPFLVNSHDHRIASAMSIISKHGHGNGEPTARQWSPVNAALQAARCRRLLLTSTLEMQPSCQNSPTQPPVRNHIKRGKSVDGTFRFAIEYLAFDASRRKAGQILSAVRTSRGGLVWNAKVPDPDQNAADR